MTCRTDITISGFIFNPTIPLYAFKMVYIAPRPAACEELKVCTVHREQHCRVNKNSSHQEVRTVLVRKLLPNPIT